MAAPPKIMTEDSAVMHDNNLKPLSIRQLSCYYDDPAKAFIVLKKILMPVKPPLEIKEKIREALKNYFKIVTASGKALRASSIEYDIPPLIENVLIKNYSKEQSVAGEHAPTDNAEGYMSMNELSPEQYENHFDPGLHVTDSDVRIMPPRYPK